MLLAWVDLETTGLSERDDPILEAAVVITGFDLVEVSALTFVINPDITAARWKGWEKRMDGVVTKMHTASGLLREVPFGIDAHAADQAFASILGKEMDDDRYALAGSGVDRFDRRFLAAQLPKTSAFLDPRKVYDVGSTRRTLRDLAGRVDLIPEVALMERNHRAMDDVQAHITEARIYAGYFDLIPREV